jgi:hypothetical protein
MATKRVEQFLKPVKCADTYAKEIRHTINAIINNFSKKRNNNIKEYAFQIQKTKIVIYYGIFSELFRFAITYNKVEK